MTYRNMLANMLKAARKAKKFTTQEVADLLDVDVKTYKSWENGKCIPSSYNLVLVGKCLDFTTDDLKEAEDVKISEDCRRVLQPR